MSNTMLVIEDRSGAVSAVLWEEVTEVTIGKEQGRASGPTYTVTVCRDGYDDLLLAIGEQERSRLIGHLRMHGGPVL